MSPDRYKPLPDWNRCSALRIRKSASEGFGGTCKLGLKNEGVSVRYGFGVTVGGSSAAATTAAGLGAGGRKDMMKLWEDVVAQLVNNKIDIKQQHKKKPF
jgi:hypothetical protein